MAGCCDQLSSLWGRRKPIGPDLMKTDLNRCLTTFDLTLLGVGHMVGSGVYVATGTVIATMAGKKLPKGKSHNLRPGGAGDLARPG